MAVKVTNHSNQIRTKVTMKFYSYLLIFKYKKICLNNKHKKKVKPAKIFCAESTDLYLF